MQTVETLINLGSKVNVIQLKFIKQLSLYMEKIDIRAQNIDGSQLKIFSIVITFFLIDDKDGKSYFFEEIFLLSGISMDIAFGMSFLILSNI